MIFNYVFVCMIFLFLHTHSKEYQLEQSHRIERSDERAIRRLLQLNTSEYSMTLPACNPQFQNCTEQTIEVSGTLDEVDSWAQVYVNVRDNTSDVCTDKEPINTAFTCAQFEELDLCPIIDSQYCRKTCKRCLSFEDICEDVLLEGVDSCMKIVEQNLCQDPIIKGKYCNNSCGFCSGPVAVPSPSPPRPCFCNYLTNNQTKNCRCSPVHNKTEFLNLSNNDLFSRGLEGIGQCVIQSSAQPGASCDFYVKSGIQGIGDRGYPLNTQCYGTGCVYNGRILDCFYNKSEYNSFVNSRAKDYCSDRGIFYNAAAQLRDAIKYDACNCTSL